MIKYLIHYSTETLATVISTVSDRKFIIISFSGIKFSKKEKFGDSWHCNKNQGNKMLISEWLAFL